VRLRKLTPLLLVLAACLGAGCGSDEEPKPSIPEQSATDLLGRLREIQDRFNVGDGACTDIVRDSEPGVRRILAALPASVDSDVRNALQDSFDHLFDLTADQCDEDKGPDTETEPTETEPTETEPTETEPTETEPTDTEPTETEPTETEPTDTSTTPTTPPDSDGGGDGGGAEGPGL
jgi:hypothetical protein